MPRPDWEPPDPLTRDEVKALLNACKIVRDEAVILCLLDTGCRASEFVSLNVGDVDMRTGLISLTGQPGPERSDTKNRKDRTVRVGVKARKSLSRYLISRRSVKKLDALWISQTTGDRLTRHGLDQIFKRLRERTGIERCYPHLLRHTFAIWSLRSGMNVYALQAIMGHSDLDTLKKYLKVVEIPTIEWLPHFTAAG